MANTKTKPTEEQKKQLFAQTYNADRKKPRTEHKRRALKGPAVVLKYDAGYGEKWMLCRSGVPQIWNLSSQQIAETLVEELYGKVVGL